MELASEGDLLRYVIVGVGVNVNLTERDFPPELRPIATQANTIMVVNLLENPADAVTMSGTCYVEELA